MKLSSLLCLFALWTAIPAWTAPVAAAPQDETPIEDNRPEIKSMIATFKGHLKKKGEEDEQAIVIIDRMLQEFGSSGPKDRAAIVKEIEGSFGIKRTKELSEGIPDDRVFIAAAAALGQMGPESVKPLSKLIGDKRHRKNERLQIQLTLSLGKTRDLEAVDTLVDLRKHKDAPMQAAGAEALGYFNEAPQDVRKEIFEQLLQTLMDQKYKKDNNTQDQEALERWNVISGPILATLQKLSGHNETDPEQWLFWWNDNKKNDWGDKG
jgi:HEAT repeat protein